MNISNVLFVLDSLDNLLWGYIAMPALLLMGIYMSYRTKCIQIRRFPKVLSTFFETLTSKRSGDGIHPLKAFFVCIGGCMGVGNVVAVCTAIQIGGPGALFWIWVTALVGMIVKYSEVYLGIRYRVPNGKGGFTGGPMYFLQKVFKKAWVPKFAALLLCIYGVEIYQFSVVTESISTNFELNKYVVATLLLALIIFVSRRGVHYIGSIVSVSIPIFIVSYLGMGAWVFYQNYDLLPSVIHMIFSSAFSGHAAMGGFAGSTILLTASQGIRRSCYAGDIAVGYASVIHSESREDIAEKQASLAMMEIFLDSFIICTTSVMIILATGTWSQEIEASMLVQQALANYFPAMNIFMPLFLLMLGITTIMSYFCAGIKCAEFVAPKYGRKIYYGYALCITLVFINYPPLQALTVLSITAGILLLLNLYGIYKLKDNIEFMPATAPSAGSTESLSEPQEEYVAQQNYAIQDNYVPESYVSENYLTDTYAINESPQAAALINSTN